MYKRQIYYDRDKAAGRPFYYYAYGVACVEVLVDTLTGEYRMLRGDILHDVGDSLNPAIDIGQVEGAFVQGMGWLTTEELVWNAKGKLMTNGPASYKIPAIADMPIDLRVKLVEKMGIRDSGQGGQHQLGVMLAIGLQHFAGASVIAGDDRLQQAGEGVHELAHLAFAPLQRQVIGATDGRQQVLQGFLQVGVVGEGEGGAHHVEAALDEGTDIATLEAVLQAPLDIEERRQIGFHRCV